jgi:tuftelin-interacting protein 11
VTRWYLGWKGLFPPDLLANPRVQRQLNAALDMMNQAVEGAPVVQPGARENMAYLKVSENRKFEQQQFSAPSMSSAPEVGQPVSSIDTGYDHGFLSMSLKEIVEATAQQNDVMFLPKVGRLYQGLQVYSFGLVSVTIDNHKQMLYAQAGEKWLPVSLEQLIELNRTRTLERG